MVESRWERAGTAPAASGLYVMEIIGVPVRDGVKLWKAGRSKNIRRRRTELCYFGNAIVRYVQLMNQESLVAAERELLLNRPFGRNGAGREFIRLTENEVEEWLGFC